MLVGQSCRLLATPWTAIHQVPLSMRFSRQGSWSGLPFPSPGDLPNPGIEPRSSTLQANSLPTELQGKPIITYNMSFYVLNIYHMLTQSYVHKCESEKASCLTSYLRHTAARPVNYIVTSQKTEILPMVLPAMFSLFP